MFTENSSSTASALDGLPDVEKQSTQEILNEIEQEEKGQLDTPKDEPEEKPKEEKPEDKPEEKPEEKPEDKETKEKPKRGPGLMPRYVHEIAVKEHTAEVTALKAEIEALKSKGSPASDEGKPTPEQQTSLKDRVEKLASELSTKHEGVSKELIQDLAQSLVDLGLSPAQIPQEVQEKLKAVDAFTAQQQAQAEEAAFNSSFTESILPLVKKEYGDLPEDTLSEIRSTLAEKAYSPEFEKTPLDVIYKGLDEFRDFKRVAARSAEGSPSGQTRTGDTSQEDAHRFDNVTDAEIDQMDAKTFDEYSRYMEKKERGR